MRSLTLRRARAAAPAAAALLAASSLAGTPLAAQTPDTDIHLVPLRAEAGRLTLGAPVNVTARAGYDNQPSFTPDGGAILYTSQRDGQTDIYRYDIASRQTTQVTRTPESEYSPTVSPDGRSITVVRVEADSAQRLWRFALRGRAAPQPLLPGVRPVGYFAWADERTLALFVLGANGAPSTLQVARLATGSTDTLLSGVGRSLHRVPGTSRVSFLHARAIPRMINELDPATGGMRRLVEPLEGAEDYAWASGDVLLMARSDTLFERSVRGGGGWRAVGSLGGAGVRRVTRLAVSPRGDWLAVVGESAPASDGAATAAASATAAAAAAGPVREADVRRHLSVLAADSMMGRLTGTPGIHKAARYLAGQFAALGLQPAGDSTGTAWAPYLQRVPLVLVEVNGRTRMRPAASRAAFDSAPAAQRLTDANVVAMIPGADPALRDEVVLVTAHYDHVGVGTPVNGDSIYNGADDDASGTVSLLEIARQLTQGAPPARTVIFAAVTGEERGLLGTNWYLANPVAPLERTVANLNIEMIGRPDTAAGGPGKGWLTGYERSTMGDMLKANGIPIIPDPRPAQNFFRRSDNYGFALRGIPAHTLSSFGLHPDYHRPSDELATIDIPHMTAVIEAAARAVRQLASGARAEWHPGGRPEPGR